MRERVPGELLPGLTSQQLALPVEEPNGAPMPGSQGWKQPAEL
jgi:hypothetical protein